MSDESKFEKGLQEFELSRRLLLGLGGALGLTAIPSGASAHGQGGGGGHGPRRLLIKGGTVITVDPNPPTYHPLASS